MASDFPLRELECDARTGAALASEARRRWTPLQTGAIAVLPTLFVAPLPRETSLLPVAGVLAGLALVGAVVLRLRAAARARAATVVLAISAGVTWAALPVLLDAQTRSGARLPLLAITIGVPAAALLGRRARRVAPALVLPSVAGGVWAILALGAPTGVALALLQTGLGALVLMPRCGSVRASAPASSEVLGRPSDDLLELLLEGATGGAGDWLWTCDDRLHLSGDLDRFATITGRPRLAGRSFTSLFAEGAPGAALLAEALAAREPFHDVIVDASKPGGAPAWWRLGGRPSYDATGRFVGFRGLGSDVTALRAAQARIAHLATHDSLTGLVNREIFQAHVARACAAAGTLPHALLVVDLDGFKQVNDDLGHAMGDTLLAAIAATLTRVAGRGAIVARLGGDEFAILYAPAASLRPETLALALIKAVSAPFRLDDQHQAQVGASIGIALAPEHAILPRDLARKADLALYRAKAAGRGRHVVFVEAYEREREEKARLEADIGLALERDEFTLHYQPLLDLAEARIGGFEALIRWTSPTRGAVTPDAFIPAAEGNGLVVAIGRFALARACRDAATWPLPVFVAVNISPQHLRNPSFRDDVLGALKASGLPPSRLEIEITEGVFLDTSRASLDALTWLRERGIKVALDDFGTGFSSLSYLVDFPVDKIKIDRSFVAGLLASHQSRAVVDAILTLARTLGMRVVAEGVETADQALALKLRRCDDLQGYVIGRPQPADAIGRLLVDQPGALRSRVPALLESSLAAALVMKRTA